MKLGVDKRFSFFFIVFVFATTLLISSAQSFAQIQNPQSSSKISSGSSEKAMSAKFSIDTHVSNVTAKNKENALKSAFNTLTGVFQNLIKTGQEIQSLKAKINNGITNETQFVQGTETISAVVGIEIGKAIKNLAMKAVKTGSPQLLEVDLDLHCSSTNSSCIYNLGIG